LDGKIWLDKVWEKYNELGDDEDTFEIFMIMKGLRMSHEDEIRREKIL
jgi:hypothetical protein